jgi:alkylated DNA repair dioxygenase AlkB
MPPPAPSVLYVPSVVTSPESLFDQALSEAEWDSMRARRTASFGKSYDYSGRTYPERPMPAWLVEVATAVEQRVGFCPNNCLLNFYADGSNTMGFHADALDQLTPGTGVAIVSVGATRRLRFRHRTDRSTTWDFPLAAGSLLFMSDDVQREYEHAIPAEPMSAPRISLTFRSLLGAQPSTNAGGER